MSYRTLEADDDLYYDRPDRSRRRRRRRRRRRSALAVILALLVVAALIGGVVYAGSRLLGGFMGINADYSGPGTTPVQVEIKEGQSTRSIANTLEDAGVVRTAGAFLSVARAELEAATIQPGYYRLRKQMKASLALAALLDEKNRINKPATIPEGVWLNDALELLAKRSDLPLKDFQAAIKKPQTLGLPGYAQGNLEGFLFPATYDVTPGTTAKGLLQEMVDNFNTVAEKLDLDGRSAQLRRSPYQVLVVASLVQAEAKHPEDFPKVARVIYNRLAKGMRLQLDSTVHYAAKVKGIVTTTARQRRIDSPYNTYRRGGLPPSPINSPGERALEAALAPAKGGWLYFVTVNPETGETKFATTDAQHEKNVAELQKWLRTH
jgi:UPF0755 protein